MTATLTYLISSPVPTAPAMLERQLVVGVYVQGMGLDIVSTHGDALHGAFQLRPVHTQQVQLW